MSHPGLLTVFAGLPGAGPLHRHHAAQVLEQDEQVEGIGR